MLIVVLFPMYWAQIRNGPALKVTGLKVFVFCSLSTACPHRSILHGHSVLIEVLVSNLEWSETPKTTDAYSFGSVSTEILVFFRFF